MGRPGIFEYNETYDTGLPTNEMGVRMNNTGFVFTFEFTDKRYQWQRTHFLERDFRNSSLFGAWYLDWQPSAAALRQIEEVWDMEYNELRSFLVRYNLGQNKNEIDLLKVRVVEAIRDESGLWPVVLKYHESGYLMGCGSPSGSSDKEEDASDW